MKVIYYTCTPFLDIAIEIINILKIEVELHVLIEVTPSTSHRIGIDKLPDNKTIMHHDELLNEEYLTLLEPYFDGCASINFIVNRSETGFSLSTIRIFHRTWHFIRKMDPDIIQIESISLRSLGIFPFLFSRIKILYTIHDPIPHTGESNWKVSIPRFLFFRLPYSRGYFFYSQFAENQFKNYYKKDNYPKFLLRMYPYSYYTRYAIGKTSLRKHILFFGSLSYYKGIDILLKAIPEVFEKFPNESLIVAGRRNDNYNINEDIPVNYKDKISILDKYISNEDLVTLIQESKFVVCPYLEATQSGVLMTAYALNTPVIASNVGAFPEYIEQNITGVLVPVSDSAKLADALITALTNKLYIEMEQNIRTLNRTNLWMNNFNIISDAYLQKSLKKK